MTTILDVVDNYMRSVKADTIDRMPGVDLWRLHEAVAEYLVGYQLPVLNSRRMPVYLGGWPSANIFDAEQSELVLTTLLYAGQVVAKDPISDWFCPHRYLDPARHIGVRPGFLNDDLKPNVANTRAFLAHVVPALHRLRPLIESQTLVLVPSEYLLAERRDAVDVLRSRLVDAVARDPDQVVRRFRPEELAVDDRFRGGFVFAGGDRETQLRRAIERSLQFFSREWLLADTVGAEYTAPWSYEQYICEHGLNKLLATSEQHRVVNALLNSKIPIYHGLTPALVAQIHDDDLFADFRTGLFEVYRAIPGFTPDAEFRKNLGQAEESMLAPTLQRAERAARRGFLQRRGVELLSTFFRSAPSFRSPPRRASCPYRMASRRQPEWSPTGSRSSGPETRCRYGQNYTGTDAPCPTIYDRSLTPLPSRPARIRGRSTSTRA